MKLTVYGAYFVMFNARHYIEALIFDQTHLKLVLSIDKGPLWGIFNTYLVFSSFWDS